MARLPEDPDVVTDFTFRPAFSVRRLDRIVRGAGQEAYLHPVGVRADRQQELSTGPILELAPPGGDAWIAVVDVSDDHPLRAPARPVLVGMPDRRSLCVLRHGRGVLLAADDPAAAGELPISPVTGHLAVEDPALVLFSGFTDVVAYGATGLAWHSDRLVVDDLRLVATSGMTLHATGFFGSPDDDAVPFTVDLVTGEASGRPFAPPS